MKGTCNEYTSNYLVFATIFDKRDVIITAEGKFVAEGGQRRKCDR